MKTNKTFLEIGSGCIKRSFGLILGLTIGLAAVAEYGLITVSNQYTEFIDEGVAVELEAQELQIQQLEVNRAENEFMFLTGSEKIPKEISHIGHASLLADKILR